MTDHGPEFVAAHCNGGREMDANERFIKCVTYTYTPIIKIILYLFGWTSMTGSGDT
jgi:hypothetical protein